MVQRCKPLAPALLGTLVTGVLAVGPVALAVAAAPAPAPTSLPAAPSAEGVEFFEKRIRPLLAAKCYACHSAEAKNVAGGFLVDTKEATLKGATAGPGVTPGDLAKSSLIRAVRHEGGLKMPPGGKLTAAEIADLEAWVKMGAPDPRTGGAAPARTGYDWEKERQFWSFRPVKLPVVPAVKNKAWPRTEIDRFVLARMEAQGVKPNPDADRRTLLRRVTFDLSGLPPTPEEMRAFLADRSPKAYEKVVDRLLASPAYGERWGRQWLDQVRYADTSGCNSDFPVPNAYKYRNWVIDALNRDLPYNQFLSLQLAGDLLPAATEEERYQQTIATGYLAIARRFGSQANEFHLTIEDTIDNVGKSMLGLSVSCARCHDHKFDPVPNTDYYALYGIFQSTKYAFPGTEVVPGEKDLVILASGEKAEAARKRDEELSDLGPKIFRLKQVTKRLEEAALTLERNAAKAPGDAELAARAKEVRKNYEENKTDVEQSTAREKYLLDRPVDVPKAYAVAEGTPADARLQKKGDPKLLGPVVPRGFLQILGGQKLDGGVKQSGRKELAAWITDPANPLTPRVMVNRLWQGHFGKGIVATPSDFGARGTRPTHPELLDYLAARFLGQGSPAVQPWSLKAMHREMVLSRVYQLSGEENALGMKRDPENKLLWHYRRHRLDAESIRDAMLMVSGNLDAAPGGEHPFPPRRGWKYTQHRPFYASYDTPKRSVYLMQQRIKKQPFLETFDGADPNTNTAERQTSTTALQALFLMNDAFIHDQARALAQRVSKDSADPAARIDGAAWLAYGRAATPDEQRLGQEFLRQARGELQAAGVTPTEMDERALASLMRVFLSSNEFVYID